MALTRITKGVIKPNENYDTHNINSTGIVTAIGLDVNGNGDISGNLNVGGVLTYEDVTSIDSVGIITARVGIDCNGDLDVDGHTNLDNVSVAGVSTLSGNVLLPSNIPLGFGDFGTKIFGTPGSGGSAGLRFFTDSSSSVFIDGNHNVFVQQGNLSVDRDLDVDGHTNLDNVNVAGVTTFAGAITAPDVITAGALLHEGDTNTLIHFSAEDTIELKTHGFSRLSVTNNGVALTGGYLNSNGNRIILGDSSGANDDRLVLGNNNDLSIYHNGSNSRIENATDYLLIDSVGDNVIRSNANVLLQPASGQDGIKVIANGSVELYHNNIKRLETSSVGVSIPQDLDVDGHTELDNLRVVGVSTFDNGAVNIINGGGAYNTHLNYNDSGINYITSTNGGGTYFRGSSNSVTAMAIQGSGPVDIDGDLRHLGDTDTKIRFPANDTISMETAGSERLRIDSDGKLQVKGTRAGSLQASDDDTLQLYTKSTNNSVDRGAGITFYNHDGSGSEMGGTIQVAKENGTANDVAAYMRFSTRPAGGSATERLRITSDGKFGFGTASLSENSIAEFSRDVGSGALGASITVRNTSTNSVNNVAELRLKTNHGIARFYKYNSGTTVIQSHTGGTSHLQLKADGAASLQLHTNSLERFRIDGNGNILTSGNIQLFGSNTSDGSDNKAIMINGGGSTSDTRGGYLLVHGNEHSSNPGTTRLHAGNVANAGIEMYTLGSERLRISANGSVGIGSDNPHRKLVVGNNSDMAVIGNNAGIYLGTHPTGGFQNNAAIARAASNDFHITGSIAGDLCIASESSAAMIFGLSHSAGAIDQAVHINRLREFNIYYGSQSIKIHTGNHSSSTERLRITSDGKVGIGEDAPQQKLHLHEDSSNGNFMVFTNSTTGATGNDGCLFGINSDEGGTIWNQENGYIRFGTSDTERLRITSTGRVGIGTDNPNFFTHIQADGVVNDALRITARGSGQMVSIRNHSNVPSIVRFQNYLGNAFWDVQYNTDNSFQLDYGDGVKWKIESNGNINHYGTTFAQTNSNNTVISTTRSSSGVTMSMQAISNPVGRVGTTSNHSTELVAYNNPAITLTGSAEILAVTKSFVSKFGDYNQTFNTGGWSTNWNTVINPGSLGYNDTYLISAYWYHNANGGNAGSPYLMQASFLFSSVSVNNTSGGNVEFIPFQTAHVGGGSHRLLFRMIPGGGHTTAGVQVKNAAGFHGSYGAINVKACRIADF